MSELNVRLIVGKRFAAASIAVAVSFGLAACSGGSPGVAAYVGDIKISEKQVTAAVKDWQMVTGEKVPRSDMAISLAQAELMVPVGKKAKLVDDDAVDEVVATFLKSTGKKQDSHFSDITKKLVAYFIVVNNLQQVQDKEVLQKFLVATEGIEMKLNPRYGSLEEGNYVASGPLADSISGDSLVDGE